MRRQKSSDNYLVSLVLAAFFFLSASHFTCNYDINSEIEKLFVKAWAETPVSTQVSDKTPAINPLLAEAARPIVTNVSLTTLIKEIARNPFIQPVSLQPKPLNNGMPFGNSKVAYSSTPVLRGIVGDGVHLLAIIEYNNTSNYYRLGQNVGEYKLSHIDTNSVKLGGSNPLHLTLGRNK